MGAEPTPLYVATRRALLDALDALEEHRDALILVGAQAIFLHTGEYDEAITTETKDADLAVDPSQLSDDPLVEEALKGAGFHLDLTNPQPGSWLSPEGVPVDLLIPEAVSGRTGTGRSGRIPPHDKMSTRRVRGIEGVLADHAPMLVSALDVDDDREYTINIAGPSALLVAKLHKVAERLAERKRTRPRDSHDVFRLMRAFETDTFVDGFSRMAASEVSFEVADQALEYLARLFMRSDLPGSQQVLEAVAGLVEDPELITQQTAVLASRILRAIGDG